MLTAFDEAASAANELGDEWHNSVKLDQSCDVQCYSIWIPMQMNDP